MVEASGRRNELGARSVLTTLFKHKTKILIIFFSILAAVTIISFRTPPVYEAKSTILVKLGREYAYYPETGDKAPALPYLPLSQEEIINAETKILGSRDLLKQSISSIGLAKLYPELAGKKTNDSVVMDTAVTEAEKALSVNGVKKSNVIEVTYQHNNPFLASKMVNLLVDNFKEKHLQVYSDPRSSFLEEQLSEYGKKLKSAEDSLQSFKQKYGVYSLDEQRNLLLEQKVSLDTAFKESQNRVKELQHRLSALRNQSRTLANGAPLYTPSERDRIITDAKAKLLDAQMKEQDLLMKYKEDNPLVSNIRKQIKMASSFLKEQEREISNKVRSGNPIFQDLEKDRIKSEADLNAERARYSLLLEHVKKVDAEVKQLDFRERGFQDLKREVSTSEKNYEAYLDRYEEARTLDDLNRKKMANVKVIQAATVPIEPVKPRKKLNIAVAIILGSMSGIGVALLSEHMSQSFSTPEKLESRLGLRVLASIPHCQMKK